MQQGQLLQKTLQATNTSSNHCVEWHECGLACEEAALVVSKVQQLHCKGVPYGEMACLTRCNKSAHMPGKFGVQTALKQALLAAGIPHRDFRSPTCVREAFCDALQ